MGFLKKDRKRAFGKKGEPTKTKIKGTRIQPYPLIFLCRKRLAILNVNCCFLGLLNSLGNWSYYAQGE